MRIVVAPDSWKASLDAPAVVEATRRGILNAYPDWVVDGVAMADGGEGTAEVVARARGGTWWTVPTEDAYGRPVTAPLLALDDGTVVVEVAAGPGFVPPARRPRPGWEATSRGLGRMIRAAVDRGARRVVVTLGGTGFSDGGMGLLEALGARWETDVPPATTSLGATGAVRLPSLPVPVECWCDVDSPLTGPTGAIFRFGPQKGLPDERLAEWDAAMAEWGRRLGEACGRDVAAVPGAGAAGGAGAALLALGATIRAGGDAVADIVGLDARMAAADVVITGEGAVDAQSAGGKVVGTVARRGSRLGKPVVALAGTVGPGADALYPQGLKAIYPALPGPMTLDEAVAGAARLIEQASAHLARWLAWAAGAVTTPDGGTERYGG
ncbi:MAG: glycerate kinase [Actinomycetia bacterium]|nr:glycerate kinase [Actinomycetes bacterium]